MCVGNQVETAKCRHCKQVKSVDLFTPNYSKLKDGTKVNRYYECKECRKEQERHKTGYYTRDKPKTALELGYKQCPKCGEIKDASNYSKCKSGKGGIKLASKCNQCRAIASRACNRPLYSLDKKRANDRRLSVAKGSQSTHRNRAKRFGVEYNTLNAQVIFERDNWTCYLCGVKVERAKKYKPNRATLDHVIPLSKGGAHTYDNVKTCCNWCNSSKGDKVKQC